jgi:hypothetical protein
MGDAFGPAHLRTTYEIPQAVTKVTSLTSHAPCIHISNLFPFACLLAFCKGWEHPWDHAHDSSHDETHH